MDKSCSASPYIMLKFRFRLFCEFLLQLRLLVWQPFGTGRLRHLEWTVATPLLLSAQSLECILKGKSIWSEVHFFLLFHSFFGINTLEWKAFGVIFTPNLFQIFNSVGITAWSMVWQYNVIVPFLWNEQKTEWPFLLYETPHPKWTDGSKTIRRWKNNHRTIRCWTKRWRTIRALLLHLRALLELLLRAVAATPLHPVHLLPLVKGTSNESSPKLRVYGAPNHICRPRDHSFSMQSFFLRSARRQFNKQTKWIVHLNDFTFPCKRNRYKTKQ